MHFELTKILQTSLILHSIRNCSSYFDHPVSNLAVQQSLGNWLESLLSTSQKAEWFKSELPIHRCSFVLGYTYWLKQGTTWNHLKPPRICMKSAILWYFLLKISYSQVAFAVIPCLKVFFGQIWASSPNWLKIGTDGHCYILFLNLMFIFSKFL